MTLPAGRPAASPPTGKGEREEGCRELCCVVCCAVLCCSCAVLCCAVLCCVVLCARVIVLQTSLQHPSLPHPSTSRTKRLLPILPTFPLSHFPVRTHTVCKGIFSDALVAVPGPEATHEKGKNEYRDHVELRSGPQVRSFNRFFVVA